MNGMRRGGRVGAVLALVLAGSIAGAGIALADDGSAQGDDGHDGTATTHCKTKFSTDIYAPLQCYPATPTDGNARGENGGNGEDGNNRRGRDGANGRSNTNSNNPGQYQNPVTQEQHTIPIPNIG
jgi:hypothetical protein